ncbi:MAG: hypothetical protein JXR96_29925 [Deltaproteobacteria bacterium]|nr:hypothetical protein [Deltaproteobacteria bacterium]
MPLAVGNRWTYETSFQQQPQADLSISIVALKDGCFLDDRPEPSRLRFDGEGLRDGNVRYLLKAPLVEGTKWMCVADVRTVEHYEIVSAHRKVQVPAGVFEDCVTVRMTIHINETRSMFNEMTFAPGVGIVEIRATLRDGKNDLPQSHFRLKRFDIHPQKSAAS